MPTDPIPQTTGWLYGEQPLVPGFYPILGCWDAEEGIFVGACFWDGTRWQGSTASAVTAFIPEASANEERALEVAYEHDPDA